MEIGMTMMSLLFQVIIVCIYSALLRWNQMRYSKKNLPPGTMGWPIFGETTEFLQQGPDFMKNQRLRCGSFFKPHILRCPTTNNIAAVHGPNHRLMRGSLLSLLSPAMMKDHLLPTIDDFMGNYYCGWDEPETVDIQEKTKYLVMQMAFLSSLSQIAENLKKSEVEEYRTEFFKLVVPGMNNHCEFQARNNIDRLLTELMQKRRESGETFTDMLGELMRKEDNRYLLTDKEIRDQVVTILYLGCETVFKNSMKYLDNHPKALEEPRTEHLALRETKRPDEPLTLNDVKSMKSTLAVKLEKAMKRNLKNLGRRTCFRNMTICCFFSLLIISNIINSVSPGKDHQVFLNFRGEELRYNFVSHLTDAFQRHEIKFFIDKNEQRGKDLKHLLVSVEESSIGLVIFSTRYTESSWCMDELVKMKKLADQGKLLVIPIFYKVEAEDVRNPTSDSEFGKKFWRLAEASSGEQIKEWKEALQSISNKMGLSLGEKSCESDFVEEIVEEVKKIIHGLKKRRVILG